MAARIETFRPEHGPAFAALNRAWLVGNDLIEPHDEEQLDDPYGEILNPGGQIFVAVQGTDVVGVCAAIPYGHDAFEVAKLAVAPSARRQGLGRQLVECCLTFARERGARRIVLVSSTRLQPALRLYESMGFQHGPVPADVQYVTADVYMELALG